mmetsp:Transcript_25103/g.73705  ORF Transcript_25103/g.73705 Transcript_25103/m.73705 type:complete len:283 (-) Transcript_25103:196-1044(-)
MEVGAGTRARALRRLFSNFPAGAAALYGDGIGPDDFERMLCHLRIQWATGPVARALFDRYDLDLSRTLTAAELEAMLFKANAGSRVRVTVGRVREALAARGATGINAMQDTIRQFRIFDKDGSGSVDREEFKRGMALCLRGSDVWPLSRADEDALFQTFDRNGDGRIAFEEFAKTVRAGLSRAREAVVLRAYEKLCAVAQVDPMRGIRVDDIARQYDANAHPLVHSGKSTPGDVLEAFLRGFDKDRNAVVSLEEFVDYYTWLSWGVGSDEDFKRMVAKSLQL